MRSLQRVRYGVRWRELHREEFYELCFVGLLALLATALIVAGIIRGGGF